MPESDNPNIYLQQVRDLLDAAKGDKASPEQFAAIEQFIDDNSNPSDPDLRFEVMRALRLRYRKLKPSNRDAKIKALRELLAVVDASDDSRAKRLGADVRDEVIHSEFLNDDRNAMLAFLKDTVSQYAGESDPYFRSRTARAKCMLIYYDREQPELFKEECRKFIQEYIGDNDEETALWVFRMADGLISGYIGDGDGYFNGVRAQPTNDKDRNQAIAVCDMMLKRFCEDKSASIQEYLQRIKDQRLDLVNDPKEIRAHVESELEKLFANPDKFPGLAYGFLGQLARAEGRRPFDVFHEWSDKVLQRPLSDGMAAAVRSFANFVMSGRETPDEAARQSEYDAAEELVVRYAGSTDRRALEEVYHALVILLGPGIKPHLENYIDVLFAKRNLLSPGTRANLLVYKINRAGTLEEKLQLNEEILSLTKSGDNDSFFLENSQQEARLRNAELLNSPEMRRGQFQEAIDRGAGPCAVYSACMQLLKLENNPAERGRILDQALAACRSRGDEFDTCSETQYFIKLLTLRADGMRDAPAALRLYHEALAAMERWDKTGRRWYIDLATMEGMLRITPNMHDKVAIYDRFIELADSAERHVPMADELRLQKAVLIFPPPKREEVFTAITSVYKERRSQSRERIENLSKALLAWLSDCEAVGRDPNDRDGVAPTFEGETVREARNRVLTKKIAELDAYPASGNWQKLDKRGFSCVSAMWMVKEMSDIDKQREVCDLILGIYGGQFDDESIGATLAARLKINPI